ncbi:hypothetical protein B0H19DRAFT_10480 [Mycena capillaripes]|nr:hypothetical protein B0H19DRAFT_10480 [Mycena capillaripes]
MRTTDPSPLNLVPTISSGALPQTSASQWAESVNDILGAHVTRTPVDTPGSVVRGALPSHHGSDSDAESDFTRLANAELPDGRVEHDQTQEDTLTSESTSMHIHAPTMASPSHEASTSLASSAFASQSSLPLDPTSVGSLSPASTWQETTESTAVNIGHGERVPYTALATVGYSFSPAAAPSIEFTQSPSSASPNLSSEPHLTFSPGELSPSPSHDSTVAMALSTTVHTGHSSTDVRAASPPSSTSADLHSPSPSAATEPGPDADLLSELDLEFTRRERPPTPVQAPRRESTPLSTTVHTGHRDSSSAVAPAITPVQAPRRDSTPLSTTVHTGHRDSSSAVEPAIAPAVADSHFDFIPEGQQYVQSPLPLSPPVPSSSSTRPPGPHPTPDYSRSRFTLEGQRIQSPQPLFPYPSADGEAAVFELPPHRCPLKCAAADCTHRAIDHAKRRG